MRSQAGLFIFGISVDNAFVCRTVSCATNYRTVELDTSACALTVDMLGCH